MAKRASTPGASPVPPPPVAPVPPQSPPPPYSKKRSALVPPEFDYEGEHGPDGWGEILAYPLCKSGKEQSPICLPAIGTPIAGPALEFNYLAPRSYRVQRDAHGISVFPEQEA